jgi:hypothetical protein
MAPSARNPAASEWLKVMTEEVARKVEEAGRGRREQELRAAERAAAASGPAPESAASRAPAGSTRPRRKTPR